MSEPAKFHVAALDLVGGEPVAILDRLDVFAEAQRAHPDLVVYLPREIQELERLRSHPELLCAAHSVKKHLDAAIIPLNSPLGESNRRRKVIPTDNWPAPPTPIDLLDPQHSHRAPTPATVLSGARASVLAEQQMVLW